VFELHEHKEKHFCCCVQLGIASPLLGVTANEGEIAATPGHQKQQPQQQSLTQLNGMTSANNANTTTTTLANTKEKTPMCLVNELARFNKVRHSLSVISGLFLKGREQCMLFAGNFVQTN
jgi:hypothetical protein